MYKLNFNPLTSQINSIYRLSDMALIPFDPANTDYIAYLAWLEAGNTPEAAE